MRHLSAAVLCLISLSAVAAQGQLRSIPSRQNAGMDRIREADIRVDLGFVASSALQGRMSLQPGDDAAIEWTSAEFAKAGL